MRTKKAFTLVEMLIVVAVIAILAWIAVGAYGGARRQAQIDLIADNLVSTLKQQQSLSKSGRVTGDVGAEEVSKCYGMYFHKGGEDLGEFKIQTIVADYYPVIDNKADVCDLDNAMTTDFESVTDFEMSKIEKFGQDEVEEVIIMFKPPFGRIVVGKNYSELEALVLQSRFSPYINFEIQLPNSDNKKFFRFDASTGLTERYYEEEL